MERLRAVAPLACSSQEAETLLPRYFETKRTSDGSIRVPLRVPLEELGLKELALTKDVVVQIQKRRDSLNLNDEFGIEWAPASGGPFPTFHGRVIVWSEGKPNASFLELDGTYEPPLGVLGEAFDATLGSAIAKRTARAFLEDVAEGIDGLRKA